MSTEDNKELIRRYMQAIDDNRSGDWSVLDEYIAEDFAARNPPLPGVSLDREGRRRHQKSSVTRRPAPTR